MVALIALMTGAALTGARWLGLPARQQRTIVIELAIQNFNLAMVVAFTLLADRAFLGPALVHLPLMLVVATATTLLARGRRGA